jgi:hypothetical protein
MPKPTSLKRPDLSNLAASWQSPLIARNQVKTFTGGLLSEKYLANLDSQGKGPAGRVKIGRKIAYNVSDLVEWLEGRAEVVK